MSSNYSKYDVGEIHSIDSISQHVLPMVRIDYSADNKTTANPETKMKTDSEKIAELEQRIIQLERLTPVKPPVPSPWEVRKCLKCGIDLLSVMGYVCPRSDCLTGLGSPHSISL